MNRSDAELGSDAILCCVSFCDGGYCGRKSGRNRIVARATGERKENLEQKIKKNENLEDFLTFSDERQRILTPFSNQILVFTAKLSSVRLGFVKMTRI
jgi:hypothetical protein